MDNRSTPSLSCHFIIMISSTASVYLPWAINLLRTLFSARSITRHSASVRYRITE